MTIILFYLRWFPNSIHVSYYTIFYNIWTWFVQEKPSIINLNSFFFFYLFICFLCNWIRILFALWMIAIRNKILCSILISLTLPSETRLSRKHKLLSSRMLYHGKWQYDILYLQWAMAIRIKCISMFSSEGFSFLNRIQLWSPMAARKGVTIFLEDVVHL